MRLLSSPRTLGWGHRAWFAAVALLSLAFLVAIPPFQTNDEPAHWHRLWTVACGELTCGQRIPAVANYAVEAADYARVRDHRARFVADRWRLMRALHGDGATIVAGGNACVYVPVAYVLPMLAMRPFVHPYRPDREAGLLTAFYAARVVNWLLMALGVLWFLLRAPELRNLTLVFYSLPTAMQQTVVVNQESTLFVLVFGLLVCWREKPRLRHVIVMLAIITVMSAMKAVFLVLLLGWAALLLRWRRAANARWPAVVGLATLGALPVVLQALWSWYVVRRSGADYLPHWGTDPAAQMALLRRQPSLLFSMLWEGHKNLLTQKHMHGGWISVLGVLGWAEVEIGTSAYVALVLAIVLALFADGSARVARGDDNPWLRWLVPMLSAYLLVPAVMLAMYLVFTAVGGPSPLGVQGRYLLFPYFMMLVIAVDFAQQRRRAAQPRAALARVAGALPWLAAALCVYADGRALQAIVRRFF